MIQDSIEETKAQFSGDESQQTKSILLLMLKLYSLRDKSFKGVIYGFGSTEITKSYSTLLERNFSNSMTAEFKSDESYVRIARSFEQIYCAHNYTILSEFSETKINYNMWSEIEKDDLTIFFQDPTINKTIKKRIFMCAVTNGFVNNSEEWSNKVGIILHYWHKKQKLIEGVYSGNFDITLFMGSNKLNCFYSQYKDEYSFIKSGIDDPIVLKDFFDELSKIIEIPLVTILAKVKNGKWSIIDNKILQVQSGGFLIQEKDQLDYIAFDQTRLEVDAEWTRLVDTGGYRVYNTETGLLSCFYDIPDEKDFRVFGLSFKKMMKLGAFNQNFNVLFVSKSDCLNLLDDLEVERPKISDITKRRLIWTSNWDTAREEKLSNDIVIEDTTESFINDLINQDFSRDEYKDILPNISQQTKFDDIIQFLLETDVIFSMKTTQRIQHYRRVFLIVKNLKYDLICSQITSNLKVSNPLIKAMKRLIKDEYKLHLEWSLVSLYDRTYQSEGSRSPEDLVLNINRDFLKRYQIISDDD